MEQQIQTPGRLRKTSSVFGDKRLDNQYVRFSNALLKKQNGVIYSLSHKRKDQVGFYRFIHNPSVTEATLIQLLKDRCNTLANEEDTVLVMHDTTIFDYSCGHGSLKKSPALGTVGNGKGWGCRVHTSLAISASNFSIIGLANLQIDNNNGKEQEASRYATAFEDKGSYRWIAGCKEASSALKGAKKVIHIMDREGDTYDALVRIKMENEYLLIRSRWNRRMETIDGRQMLLDDYLKQLPVSMIYEMEITGESGKRKKRKAVMEIRFSKIAVFKQNNFEYQRAYPAKEFIWIIEAKETAASIPEGEEPVHWKLISTEPVETWVEAAEKIFYYSLRWKVEDLFRLVKGEGFGLESCELRTGKSIRKLIIMIMDTALKALQLRQARDGEIKSGAGSVFTEIEQECLKEIGKNMEGETEKQQNPHTEGTLAWATWIISRLGGWSGYASQRKPGTITIKRGLERFEYLLYGWLIANGRDVCKQ